MNALKKTSLLPGEFEDLQLPGFNLHLLKSDRAEIWSIKVSGNWRMTFRFEDGDVYIVDYEDYH